jgi:hypothetical protein
MNKAHAAGIALLLGAAAVLGMMAATRTAGLGRAATAQTAGATTSKAIAWRAQRLGRIEAALRRSLRSRPPKLPPIPAVQQLAPPTAVAAAPAPAAPPRVVYQRPPPIVVVKHRTHRDDQESGEEGGGDD